MKQRELYWKRPPGWKKRHAVSGNIYYSALCGVQPYPCWPEFFPHDTAPKCKICERKAAWREVFE